MITKAPTGNEEAAKYRNERTYRSPPVSFQPATWKALVAAINVTGMVASL
jgi:hypothetical protein